ncbi:hypothetical protein [Marivivens donghaensis]|uniref:hypothetical protein n=1 Tax=Marivivens donghaensis TaxID=1699413 RepID=UPI003F69CDF0
MNIAIRNPEAAAKIVLSTDAVEQWIGYYTYEKPKKIKAVRNLTVLDQMFAYYEA